MSHYLEVERLDAASLGHTRAVDGDVDRHGAHLQPTGLLAFICGGAGHEAALKVLWRNLMSSNLKAKMLDAALEVLIADATTLRGYLALAMQPDSDEKTQAIEAIIGNDQNREMVSDIDNAIEAVLEARNEFCLEQEILIEDGAVNWKKSEAQSTLR